MSKFSSMRPDKFYEKMLITREKCGTEFFLNESSKFVDTNCPACGKSSSCADFSFYKYGFRHMSCPDCATLYVSPRPQESQLSTYYTVYDAPRLWTEILLSTNDARKVVQHMPRVKKLCGLLEEHTVGRECFVDLGAGNGNFAKAIADAGLFKRVIACDLSPHCAKVCQDLGLESVIGTAESFAEDSLDCVSSNDLIEHLFNPEAFLLQLHSRMRERAMLMLATPNGEGFDFKLLNDKVDNITPPEHLQYFNPGSISILLEKAGFRIIDVTTPGVLDVEIVKRQRNQCGFNLSQSNVFLEHIYKQCDNALEAAFQSFLADNKLSSHMLIFAQKI